MLNQPRITVAPKPKRLVPTTISLTVTQLRMALDAVIHAAYEDDNRPILSSVHFTPVKGTWHVVACDNYRVADYATGITVEGKPTPFTVALTSIKELMVMPWIKSPAKYGGPRNVTITTSLAKRGKDKVLIAGIANDQGFTMGLALVDGEYPNWEKVTTFPRKRARAWIALTPAYISEVARAIDKLATTSTGYRGNGTVILEVWDPEQPVRITGRRGLGLIETLMPVRLQSYERPGWKPAPPARETGQPTDEEDGGEEEVHDAA